MSARVTGGKEMSQDMNGRMSMTTSASSSSSQLAGAASASNGNGIDVSNTNTQNLPVSASVFNTGLVRGRGVNGSRSVLNPQVHHNPSQHQHHLNTNTNTNTAQSQFAGALPGLTNNMPPHVLEQLQLLEAQQQQQQQQHGHGMNVSSPLLGMQMNDSSAGAALASLRNAMGNVPAPSNPGMFNGQSGAAVAGNVQDVLQRQELLAVLAMAQQQQQQLSYLSGGAAGGFDTKSLQLAQQLGLTGVGNLSGLTGGGSLSNHYDLQAQLMNNNKGAGEAGHLDLLQAQLLLKQQQSQSSQASTASHLLSLSNAGFNHYQQQQNGQFCFGAVSSSVPVGNTALIGRDESSNRELPNKLNRVSIRVPCCARDMPIEHNFQTAYFTIDPNMEHGTPLVCSYESCSASGTKFRYCLYCDKAVHKRNFWKEHKHSDEEQKQPQNKQQQDKTSRDNSIIETNQHGGINDDTGARGILRDEDYLLAAHIGLHNLSQLKDTNNGNGPRPQSQPVKVSLRSDGTFSSDKNPIFNDDLKSNDLSVCRKRGIEKVLEHSSLHERCDDVERNLILNWVGLLMERPQTEESHAMRQWLQNVLSVSENMRVKLGANGALNDGSPVERQKPKQGSVKSSGNSASLSTNISKGGSDEGDDEAKDDAVASDESPNREEVESEEV